MASEQAPGFNLGTPATWASSSGRRCSPGFRPRPPRRVTSWFCRKHTGRPPQNFLPQDGIAFRLHLQTTRLRPQRARKDAGARPTSLRRRRHGLSQVPPWSGQTRQEEATQSRRGRLTQHSGTAPRHIWVQSQSGRACCAMGGGLRLRPSQLCSLLSCYRRGQAVLGVTAYVLWSTQPSLRPIAGSPELPSVGRH